MMATIIAVAITYRCRSSVMPTMIAWQSTYADRLLGGVYCGPILQRMGQWTFVRQANYRPL